MSESLLLQSYRDSQKSKATRALDEALARADAAQAEATAAPITPVPDEGVAPPAQPAHGRAPGVAASIGRGLVAIPKRFMEGIDTLGGVIMPITPAERGESGGDPNDLLVHDSAVQRVLSHPAVRAIQGLVTVGFPFSAAAYETGADFSEWISRGSFTDATLQARLGDIRRLQGRITDPAGQEQLKQGAANIAQLLTLSEPERVEQARERAGTAADILAGVIPGYTNPAPRAGKPPEVPRQ